MAVPLLEKIVDNSNDELSFNWLNAEILAFTIAPLICHQHAEVVEFDIGRDVHPATAPSSS